MKRNDPVAIQALRNLFESDSDLRLWIIRYGATHHVIECQICKLGIPDRIKLICGGCYYICGDPSGGPYVLKIEKIKEQNIDEETFQITGNDDQFVIKFLDIKINLVEGETFSRFFTGLD